MGCNLDTTSITGTTLYSNSIEACFSYCSNLNSRYGLLSGYLNKPYCDIIHAHLKIYSFFYRSTCSCLPTLNQLIEGECNTPCPGNANEVCGNSLPQKAFSVFDLTPGEHAFLILIVK